MSYKRNEGRHPRKGADAFFFGVYLASGRGGCLERIVWISLSTRFLRLSHWIRDIWMVISPISISSLVPIILVVGFSVSMWFIVIIIFDPPFLCGLCLFYLPGPGSCFNHFN